MSTPRWFYAQDDNRLGPVPVEQIAQLVMKGELGRDALVWRHGLTDWTEAGRIPEIASLLPPPLPAGGKSARAVETAVAAVSEADARRDEIRGRLEGNPRRYAQVAEDLRKEGDHENAIWVCREGLERYAYPSLRLTLSRALLDSGQAAAARGELETMLQATPDNIAARRLLDDCRRALGEPAPAEPEAPAPAPRAASPAARPPAAPAPPAPARPAAAVPPPSSPAPPDAAEPAWPAAVTPPPDVPAAPVAPPKKRRTGIFGGVASVLFPDSPAKAPPALEVEPLQALIAEPEVEPEPEPETPAIIVEAEDEAEPEPPPAPPPAPPPPPLAAAARPKKAAPPPPADEITDLPTLQAVRGTTKSIDRALQERKKPALPAPAIAREEPAPQRGVAWPSGRLPDHEFPDLVREVYARRWSGLLTLNHMGAEKGIRIQEGRLVFASSSIPDDRLGELLLRRGRITLHQYVEAGHLIRKGGKRLGTILVDMGALDARELVKVVVDHTLEIIYGAFQWTEGLYHFTETVGAAEDIVLKLSTPEIILEGIRRIDRWSRIERAVGGLETRYQRAEAYQTLVPHTLLSPDKMAILTGLAGITDLGTICKQSSLPHFEVCRTLWAYRVIGAVQRVD
jgi:hypothetical protein